jgi:antitoxin component of MazEF toxin-antitoxin module
MNPSMNKRKGRVHRVGGSLVITLPVDWIRGNEVRKGDELEIEYDGDVTVKAPRSVAG